MRILYVEPFLGGSHQQWIEGYKKNSQHTIEVIGLPDKLWKWRMIGGAVTLANEFNKRNIQPDIIMVSDMLDLTTFKALINFDGPIIAYFHENQITYPLSPNDTDIKHQRDHHYGFINFTTALVADEIWFNSQFHKSSFLGALPGFLNQFPDYILSDQIAFIEAKSKVAHVGMDLKAMDSVEYPKNHNEIPIILWNHRWEHDKNPSLFFESLIQLKEEGVQFRLVALGEYRGRNSQEWIIYKDQLQDQILQWGFVKSYEEYISWLKKSDIIAVTSIHDYFGISVIEAIHAGCFPLLPNRLAYPEHVPDILKPSILYSDGDFYIRLKNLIASKSYQKDITKLRTHIQKYDWSIIAPNYDGLMDYCEIKFSNKS